MRFHTCDTGFDRRHPDNRQMKWPKYYKLLLAQQKLDDLQSADAIADMTWLHNRRPYYNVYPAITDMLTGVKLDVDCSFLKLPYNPLAIQFAEGKEPLGIQSILVAVNCKSQAAIVSVDYGGDSKSVTYFPIDAGQTIEERLAKIKQWDHKDKSRLALRIVLSLCLLDNDPELILPDVLAADRVKWEGGDDQLKARLEQRAKQRGKFGWVVGRGIEVVPHIRRPHLALRWTGEGRKIPKIVSIKPCIVHRNKLLEIPTGFGDDNGAESCER